MNTLQDLRATLDRHAGDVPDAASAARLAAVRGRAHRVRRQRAGAVVVAAVVAVVGVVLVPSLGDGSRPTPADRELLGQMAPATITSLGWTYRFTGSEESVDSREVSVRVPRSAAPRLVTWTTAGDDQSVTVRTSGSPRWRSQAEDFGDFAWVHQGIHGRVTVTADQPGLALAVYEVDPATSPAGVGEGLRTFRRDVAGHDLLGAVLGSAGQASVTVDLEPSPSELWVGYTCENVPRGVRMNIGLDRGRPFSWGDCSGGASFDPGGSPGTGLGGGLVEKGGTLRMWLSRDGRPVADGELPGVRIGIGGYVRNPAPARVGFYAMGRRIEAEGHVWELERVARGPADALPTVTVPGEGDFLVAEAVSASDDVRYRLTADGRSRGGRVYTGRDGGSQTGGVRASAGETYSLAVPARFADRVRETGLFLYRRVD